MNVNLLDQVQVVIGEIITDTLYHCMIQFIWKEAALVTQHVILFSPFSLAERGAFD